MIFLKIRYALHQPEAESAQSNQDTIEPTCPSRLFGPNDFLTNFPKSRTRRKNKKARMPQAGPPNKTVHPLSSPNRQTSVIPYFPNSPVSTKTPYPATLPFFTKAPVLESPASPASGKQPFHLPPVQSKTPNSRPATKTTPCIFCKKPPRVFSGNTHLLNCTLGSHLLKQVGLPHQK
ncbi:hypothetical protein HBN54_003982 [Hymenobacter sp. 1B]|uniref:Uncharacterized protein n=1 Tax=Hymenobacter artigasi TaxID=2719616 RepID=A0ABX1HML5_9BACT|nr:hypothetical protein [Hymenobacter artigasi]